MAQHIYNGGGRITPYVKIQLISAVDVACDSDSASVLSWLVSIWKALPIHDPPLPSFERHFERACEKGWIGIARGTASAIGIPQAKDLFMKNLETLAKRDDRKVFELIEWAIEEWEISAEEIGTRMYGTSRGPLSYLPGADLGGIRVASTACPWLDRYAGRPRTTTPPRRPREEFVRRNGEFVHLQDEPVFPLRRGIFTNLLPARMLGGPDNWFRVNDDAPRPGDIPLYIEHSHPVGAPPSAPAPIPRDFHVDEDLADVVFSDEEMPPPETGSSTAPPAPVATDYHPDGPDDSDSVSSEDESLVSPRRLSTYAPETDVGIKGDIVRDVGKLFKEDGDV